MSKKQNSPLKTLLAASLAMAIAGCSEKAEEPADTGMVAADKATTEAPLAEPEAVVAADNPFFVAWDTPYGIPPFDSIKEDHYKPAFDKGIVLLKEDIAAIRDNPEAPTFKNTIEAMETAGPLITNVMNVFGNITNTNIKITFF